MITYTTKKDAARNKIAFNPCTTQHEIGRDVKCFAVVQALVLWRRNHFLQRPPFASNLDVKLQRYCDDGLFVSKRSRCLHRGLQIRARDVSVERITLDDELIVDRHDEYRRFPAPSLCVAIQHALETYHCTFQ